MKTASLDRRSFLKTAVVSAGATLGAGLAGGAPRAVAETAAKAPADRPRFFKAIQWGMIKEPLSIEDKFRLVKDLGFDGLELNSPGGVDKAAAFKASEKTGVRIHGVVDSTHWQFRLSDPDPAVREHAVRDLQTAIRDCHRCGGLGVLLVPGHGKDGTQAEVAARSMAQIQKALPLAANLGVHILIENVWNHFCYQHNGPDNQSADQLAAFIDSGNSPWINSYFDIGNHRKYTAPSKWVRQLGHRIIKVHVKDFNHHTNKWAEIGEGTVDWPQVRAELGRLNFCGWATAEVGGGDRKRLARIKAQMDRVLG
jgi:hexulose-6-phosphate isomerase